MMMGIKNTCRDLGILAVVLSQMDRETDRLTGRQRPQLADLKGSGDIEQESDAIGLMWRHNKKDKETKKGIVPDNIAMIRPVEFIWAKNRHGASDVSVQMVFDEKFIEFREWNDAEEEHCRSLAMQATSDSHKENDHGKSETTGISSDSGGFTEEPGD
jgi:replicative DNA helicase